MHLASNRFATIESFAYCAGERTGITMTNKKGIANIHEEEWELEETGLPDEVCLDRTLVLRREPLPRKVHLMAAGVREIRCISCGRIKPIAGAEELGEGWICEDCLSDAAEVGRCGGQRGA
jgi:hypothetical protein